MKTHAIGAGQGDVRTTTAERVVPTLGCIVALACAPRPQPQPEAEEEATPGDLVEVSKPATVAQVALVSPRWRIGDEWDVHYKIAGTSWKKQLNAPPSLNFYDWNYALGHIADDGTVSINATAPERDAWRMAYRRSGQLVAVWTPFEELSGPVDAPFVPITTSSIFEPLAKYWPKFPLRPGEVERAEDGSWEQRVTRSGDKLTVTFVGRGEDRGEPIQRTVIQEWEKGRPWWSSLIVRVEPVLEGDFEDGFEMEGHVTAWRLAEDP